MYTIYLWVFNTEGFESVQEWKQYPLLVEIPVYSALYLQILYFCVFQSLKKTVVNAIYVSNMLQRKLSITKFQFTISRFCSMLFDLFIYLKRNKKINKNSLWYWALTLSHQNYISAEKDATKAGTNVLCYV